jgi:small subunit ribosomal protein S11
MADEDRNDAVKKETRAESPAREAAEKQTDSGSDRIAPAEKKGEDTARDSAGADVAEAQAPGVARTTVPAAKGKERSTRQVSFGIAHIRATFNNTLVTISDAKGGVLAWHSAGRAGFKGSRKSSAFAAGVVGQEAARQAIARGMREVEVRVQGPGAGRETAIRSLQSSGLTITMIKDVTPMPHNGCRPRKRRRV